MRRNWSMIEAFGDFCIWNHLQQSRCRCTFCRVGITYPAEFVRFDWPTYEKLFQQTFWETRCRVGDGYCQLQDLAGGSKPFQPKFSFANFEANLFHRGDTIRQTICALQSTKQIKQQFVMNNLDHHFLVRFSSGKPMTLRTCISRTSVGNSSWWTSICYPFILALQTFSTEGSSVTHNVNMQSAIIIIITSMFFQRERRGSLCWQ